MRISPLRQLALTTFLVVALFAWAVTSISAMIEHMRLGNERERLQAHRQEILAQDRSLKQNRRKLDERARTLESRQRQLERIVQQYLGVEFSRSSAAAPKQHKPTSLASIDERLAVIERRQLGFASAVTRTTTAEQERQSKALRRLGLRAPYGGEGRGGPFIPYDGPLSLQAAPSPEELFAGLRASLGQWQESKDFMAAIPVGRPVARLQLSSPFGIRSDPFTRRRAAHLGQDFRGPYGDPIMAAGEGRVIHAGWMAGYGKAVQVDHGFHLVSLYGHLSRITVREGERVERGQRLGLMGSTGRSTGSHLHYEVRLNGRSVNPRPFMEMNLVR